MESKQDFAIEDASDGEYDFIPDAMKCDSCVVKFGLCEKTTTLGELKDMHYNNKLCVTELARYFGTTPNSVRHAMRAHGMRILNGNKLYFDRKREGIRKNPYKTPSANYPLISAIDTNGNIRPKAAHRVEMERFLGRRLEKTERVHHIDFDKDNYDLPNLYLCKNESAHAAIHVSLEDAAKQLFKCGIIKFDDGRYFIDISLLDDEIVYKFKR